jgi:hypothetical protein
LPRFTVTAYWTGDLIFAVFLGYLGEEENVAYPSVYTIENCDGTPEDSTAYGGVVSFEFVE